MAGGMRVSLELYWAGPLFTQAERIWNRRCAELLRGKQYAVILPQEEADKIIAVHGLDLPRIVEQCYQQAIRADVMVAVLDGADSDSGTSVEIGLRIGHLRATNNNAKKTIGVRTDFRASEDGQLNAMFRLLDRTIYSPSLKSEDPVALCAKIDGVIREVHGP
jgi:nucleoside 2-deoxyribosyltransferase